MPSLEDVRKAATLLRGRVIRTPLVYSPTFSRMTGSEVYLKLENLQETGSFKIRGATYKILSEGDKIGKEGVVAASAGNHAQGVALAASRAGLRSTIVMPEWSSISKQEATRGYGGELVLTGQSITDCLNRARELETTGKTFIHPYDDPGIIAGQGTVGLEIMEDLPDTDVIVAPVGGGGLISGIAIAAKEIKPRLRMIGVQAAACPSAPEALESGQRVVVEARRSIADGIAVKQIGEIAFQVIREKVGEVVLVDEDWIAQAVLILIERKKLFAEGAGAVAVAALLSGVVSFSPGQKVVLVISGGNMDSPLLDRVLRKGLLRNGRIMRFSICLDDIPGSLSSLLSIIAQTGANVLQIYHNRGGKDLSIYQSLVELEIETRNFDHIAEISGALESAGYRIKLRHRASIPLA